MRKKSGKTKKQGRRKYETSDENLREHYRSLAALRRSRFRKSGTHTISIFNKRSQEIPETRKKSWQARWIFRNITSYMKTHNGDDSGLRQWDTRLGKYTIRQLSLAFRYGLVRGCERDGPKTFWQFYEYWKRCQLKRKPRADNALTMEMIDDSVEEYKKHANGKCPSARSGLIKYGLAANGERTWQDVQNALYQGRVKRCPYKTLPAYLVGRKHKLSKIPLTIANIRKSILATFLDTKRKTGKGTWITLRYNKIVCGPLKQNRITGAGLNSAVRFKTGGLTPAACPYNSLSPIVGEVRQAYERQHPVIRSRWQNASVYEAPVLQVA